MIFRSTFERASSVICHHDAPAPGLMICNSEFHDILGCELVTDLLPPFELCSSAGCNIFSSRARLWFSFPIASSMLFPGRWLRPLTDLGAVGGGGGGGEELPDTLPHWTGFKSHSAHWICLSVRIQFSPSRFSRPSCFIGPIVRHADRISCEPARHA